jgi:hypothetical protein
LTDFGVLFFNEHFITDIHLNTNTMLEIYGTVAKEENVKTVEHYILPNTFVVQNLEPYPGYHGENLPTDAAPDTFFMITSENHSPEKIFRISHNIRSLTGYTFDGSTASLCIENEVFPAIRIRDLNSYELLQEIQKYYFDEGIHFQKKRHINELAFIELKKIFQIEKINEHILKDKDGATHYLNVESQLSWSRFKAVTHWVKNNLDDRNFDAALIVMYGKEVYDLVRVYSKNITPEQLENIRIKYLEAIKRSE